MSSMEIDVAAATAALNDAGGVESLMHQEAHGTHGPDLTQQSQQQTEVQTPSQEQSQVQNQPVQGQPVSGLMRDPTTGRWTRAEAPAAAATSAEVAQNTDFTSIDPSTLDPQLQAIYKSLQADYTRKTQEIANQRREFEQLGPLDSVVEAVNVYNQLQNPDSWPALHAELTQGLQALGMSQQEASATASAAVAEQQAQQVAPSVQDPFAAYGDDADIAPVKSAYEQMAQQLNELKSQYEADRQAQQQEQLTMSLIGEMQRQENIIRQARTDYTDEDVKAIYELASFHDGNLLNAQQRYEVIFNDRLSRYMAGKQGVAENMTVLPGATQQSMQQHVRPKTLDEGHALAMEALRAIEAASG